MIIHILITKNEGIPLHCLDGIFGDDEMEELTEYGKSIYIVNDLENKLKACGVIHNDLEPRNIIVNKDNNGELTFKVIDFEDAIFTDDH